MTTLDGGQAGGSRKRLRMSRNDTASPAAADGESNKRLSPALDGLKTLGDTSACDKPCHHETALQSLHTELDTMRSLLSCQVCRRLMYEPFALSCGHTYCYSCIDQWMHHKKECPSCRSKITQQPTQSYALRDLVLVFAGRTQLLADGETAEEHETLAKEEQQVVAKDKANADEMEGGLFKGLFRTGGRLLPIRDPVDGVDRCPTCHWEIEDGYCNSCGRPVGDDMSDFSSDGAEEEDLDDDLVDEDNDDDALETVYSDADPEDEVSAFDARDFHQDGQTLAVLNAQRAHLREVLRRRVRQVGVDEESRSSDEEDDSTMGDFVVDDDADPSFLTDEEDAESGLIHSGTADGHPLVIDGRSEEESGHEDEDDEPHGIAAPRNRHTVTHRKRPIVVSSDDEQDEEQDEDDNNAPVPVPLRPQVWNNGFSPIQLGSDHEQSGAREDDDFGSLGSSECYGSDSDDQQEDEVEDDDSQDEVGNYNGFGGYDDDDDDNDDDDDDDNDVNEL